MGSLQWCSKAVLSMVLLLGMTERGRVMAREGKLDDVPPEVKVLKYSCDFQGLYPYIVSVRDNTDRKQHICGGVLIAEDAVLTAAHCVDPKASAKATTAPDLHIGGVEADKPVQKRKTVLASAHPKWTGNTRDGNDLIILKLNKKVCLDPIPYFGVKDAEDREKLIFLGYGHTTDVGSYSKFLQFGQFNTLNLTHCNDRFEIDPPLGRGDLCVRGQTSVGICSGDDGGPLIYQPTLRKFRDVLIGIASFTTADCTETEGAAVFMDIEKYKKWIKMTCKRSSLSAVKVRTNDVVCSEVHTVPECVKAESRPVVTAAGGYSGLQDFIQLLAQVCSVSNTYSIPLTICWTESND